MKAKVIERKLKPEDVEIIRICPQGYDPPPFQPVGRKILKKYEIIRINQRIENV